MPALLRTIRTVLLPSPGSRGRVRRVERPLFAVVRGWDDPKAGPYRFDIPAPRRVRHSKPSGQFTHSSSSHSPMAPSGEARARTQASTMFALAPRRLAGGVAGGARSRARAPVMADISERRTSSLGSGPCSPGSFPRSIQVQHGWRMRPKGPHQRLDPTPVMPVDERASTPSSAQRRTRDRAAADPGQGTPPPLRPRGQRSGYRARERHPRGPRR